MMSASGVSCGDLRARAAYLAQAADLVESALADLPGPETRAGFSGPVRFAYDLSLTPLVEQMTKARHTLQGAEYQLHLAALRADETS